MTAGARGRACAEGRRTAPEPPRPGRRVEAEGPPSPRAPLVGASYRPKEERRCEEAHRQGCDPRPTLSRRPASGEYRLKAVPGGFAVLRGTGAARSPPD